MTIALIDRQPLLLSGLSLFLRTQFEDLTLLQADSIHTLHSLPVQWPDLFIMGFGQNTDADNLDFLSRARRRHKVKTIAFDESPDAVRAKNYLQTGVNGYLSKQNNLLEFAECVKQVLKGESYVCRQVTALLNQERPMPQQISRMLTQREMQITKLLAQGMKTSWIAEKLERKASTISTMKNTIFRKLEVENIIGLRKRLAC